MLQKGRDALQKRSNLITPQRRQKCRLFGVFSYPVAALVVPKNKLSQSALRCRQAILALVCLLVPLSVLLGSLVVRPAQAATNNVLNFQARLLNSSGSLVADGTYNIRFKLYDGGTSGGPAGVGEANAGTLLWTDTRYDQNGVTAGLDYRVTVKNGYFSVNLGDTNAGGTAFPSTINWDQELWLTMDVGGTTQTATPTWDGEMLSTGNKRTRLTSVPFAQSAAQLQATSGSNTMKVTTATPTAAITYTFQDAAAGTYNVCTSANNCTGLGAYIQNGTSNQNSASFNIQSGAIGTVTAKFRAFAGQTADVIQVRDSGDTSTVFSVTPAGNVTAAGNVTVTGTYNSNTFNSTSLTFGGASATTIQAASNQTLTLQTQGTGTLVLNSNSGIIRSNNQQQVTMTRTLPTVVNDAVDIGSFALTSGGGRLGISIVVPSSGNSVAKEYLLPIQYNQTANTWVIAQPISDTGAYSGQNFALDVNVNNGTASLRIRRTAGATAGTAYVTIMQQGVNTDAFTGSSSTASVAAPSTYLSNAIFTQSGGAASVQGSLTATNGLTVTAGGLTVTGTTNINTSGTAATNIATGTGAISIGNTTGILSVSGSASSSFVIGANTVSAAEFVLLDGRNAALVDTNDAVATAITGTGTLTSGSLGAGFTTVAVARGGTGATTLTQYGVLYGNGTSAIGATSAGTAGQCLVSGGAGAAPSYASCGGTGSGVTLQAAYDNSTSPATISTADAKNILFTLNNTTTDPNFLVNIATGSTSKFAVQNNGTDVLTVTNSGASVTGTLGVSGTLTVNSASAATDNIVVGSNTVYGNDANDGCLTIYGEQTGAIGSGSFCSTGTNLQIAGSGQSIQLNPSSVVQILSGKSLGFLDSGNTTGASFVQSSTSTLALNTTNTVNAFNIDSNTLSVDALNNRVGIGTTAPGTVFEVNSDSAQLRLSTVTNSRQLNISQLTNGDASVTGFAGALYFGAYSGNSSLVVSPNGSLVVNSSTGVDTLAVDTSANTVTLGGVLNANAGITLATTKALSYAGNYRTYERTYSVNTATPAALVDDTATNFSATKSYSVRAFVTGTGTQTGATAIFYGDGTNFTLYKTYEAGTSSNHIEFYLNAGVPSVRLYSHATLYSVSVITEEVANKSRAFGPEINLYGDSSGNINIQSGNLQTAGTTRLTNAGVLQNVTNANADTFFTANSVPVARGGTGAATFTSNGILYGNTTGALQVTAASTGANQCLITATAGGVPSWGSCTAGGGVTTVGALNGGTANANGATISTNTIYLQSASATNPGLVDTTTQTFAGAKTFNTSVGIGSSSQFQVASTGLTQIVTTTGGPILYVKESGVGYANANAAIVADTDNTTGTANYLYQGRLAGTNVFSVRADGLITGVGVNAGSGLIQGTGGLTVTGTTNINTSGAAATNIATGTGALSIGNSTGILTVTGSSSSAFVLGGVNVSATEFNLLDGRNAALVDTNDAVATAITGTGALNAGSITSGFGAIDTGADNISTTGAVNAGTSTLTNNFAATNYLQAAGGTGFRFILNNDGTFRLQKTTDGFSTLNSTPLLIDSSNNITLAGALSGITTISTSSTINGQTISSAANFTGTLAVATSVSTPLITNAGTLNVRTTGSNDLTVGTNGTTRLTVRANGSITQENGVIQTIGTGLHTYENLASVSASGAVTGATVITTNLNSTDSGVWFTDMNMTVYDYSTNNQDNIDLSFYKYVTPPYFYNYGYNRSGSINPLIRLAHNGSGKVVIIIGDTGTSWSYPKVKVNYVTSNSSTLATFEGWTVTTGVTSFTGYTDITTISEENTVVAQSISNTGGYTQTGASANTLSGATSFTASGTALSVTNNASIGGTLAVTGNTTLTGTLAVNGGTISSTAATLVVNAGGTVDIQDNVTVDSLTADTGNVAITSGVLSTAGTTRLTNAGVLQNVTNANADTFFTANSVPVARGGTGATTLTQYGILYGNNASAVQVTAAGTTGQCLVATTGAAPAWGSCAGGGSGVTLQAAYDNSTSPATISTADAKNILFTLNNTTTDPNFLVNIATGSTSKFAVQNNGTDVLSVTSTGATVAGTLAVTGATTINTTGAAATSIATGTGALTIGNSTGTLTVTGSSSSTFVLNGTTVDATEFNRLDGKNAALVDTNDAVATAITGTGALNAGSITSGFGAIDTGADNITTTGTVSAGVLNGSSSNSTTLVVTSTKSTATAAEAFGQQLTTNYTIADTSLKQGLRVTTNANNTTGSVGNLVGGLFLTSAGGNGGTVTAADGLYVRNDSATGATLTTSSGISIYNGTGAGTITTQYGMYIQDLTKGGSDYGIRIDGADTQVLWLGAGADNTDAANGIAFGASRDTNLYRSAANTLRTDDALNVGSTLAVSGTSTFTGLATANGGLTVSGTTTITSTADDATYTGFVTNDSGVLKYRTLSQTQTDLGISPKSTGTLSGSTASSTWYRVATFSGSQGRGSARIIVSNTGGSGTPNQIEFRATKDWSTAATLTLLSQSGTQCFAAVRIVDNTNVSPTVTYVDVQANAVCTNAFVTVIPEETNFANIAANNFTAPAGGTETTRTTLDISGNTFLGISSTFATDNLLRVTSSGINTTTGYIQTGSTANTFTGATTFSAAGTALSVTNTASIGTLSVTNNATVSGTLGVTGNTTLTGDLAVNGGDITTTATTFNLINTTASTLNVGGAATSINLGATTGTTRINNALRVGDFSVERVFNQAFSNGTADQKFDLYFSRFWGEMEVTLTSAYSNQNASGSISKKFFLGLNPSNSIYTNTSRYTESSGATPDNFAISDVTWDATNSRYRIQIVHRTSTGNTVYIRIKALGASATDTTEIATNLAATAVYTTDTTVFAKPIVSFTDDINLVNGALQTAGTTRLTNAGVLQNVTNANADTFFTANSVPVARGGTGASTFTQYGILYGNNASAVQVTAAGTTGQCLVATTGAAPAWGSCAGGSGSGVTLQAAYDNSTSPATISTADAKNILFTLNNTTTDPNFLVNIATGSTSKFAVQNNGTDVLSVTSTGATVAGTLTATLPDATANALDIQEGTNDYINISTANGGETISFGNNTTDQAIEILSDAKANNQAKILSLTGSLTYTTASSTEAQYAVNYTGTVQPTAAASGYYYGGFFAPSATGANVSSASIVGVRGDGRTASASTTGTAVGGMFNVQNTGAGTLTNGRGIMVPDFINSGGGSISNRTGIAVDEITAGTTTTNLLLGTLTNPAGNWSLYSASTRNSAFAGNLRVGGTTAPTAALDVTGAVAISTTLSVTGNTTLTGDIAVNGGDLTTGAATFNLVNGTATTVNFAGGATTLSVGANTGTTTVNNNLTVDDSLTVGVASGAGSLSIKPGSSADHAYLQIYADSAAPNTRSAYIGYGSAGTTTLTIGNEIGDQINIGLSGDDVTVADVLNVGGNLQTGGTTRLSNTGALQSIASITGTGALAVNATAGNLTLGTTTSGNVVIDGAGNLTVTDNAVFNGTITANTDTDFTLAGTENIAVTSDLAGTVNVLSVVTTPSATAGTTRGLFLQQANSANTNGLDAGIVIDNADTDLALTTGILIQGSTTGAVTTAIDLSDAEIATALALGTNDVTVNGATLAASELSLLDGRNAALVDTNDAVATAITGVGTLTAGTWNATAIGPTYGGTGQTTVTTGDLLYGSATNTWGKLAAVAAGSCLISNGVGAAPLWGSCGSGITLQSAYTADADGGDAIIALTTADDSLIFRNPLSGGSDSEYVLTIDQLNTAASKSGLLVASAGADASFALRVNDDGTLTDSTPFAVLNTGNVVLGGTTVSGLNEKLSIVTSSGVDTYPLVATNGSAVLTTVLWNGGWGGIGTTTASDGFTLYANDGAAEINLFPSGYTTVGSNSGNYLATGYGDLYVEGNLQVSDKTIFQGTVLNAAYDGLVNVYATSTSTTNEQRGLTVNNTVSVGSATVQPYSAVHGIVDGTTNVSGAYLSGVLGQGRNNGTSTVGNLYGVQGQILTTASGTTSSAAALYANTPNNPGTILTLYGLLVAGGTGGGTVNNNIGIATGDTSSGTNSNINVLIGAAPGSGNWSIYNNSTDNNAFGGSLRVGSTTAPTVALDVTGSGLITRSGNTNALTVTANSVTTGVAVQFNGTGVTTGSVVQITGNTAATSGYALNVSNGRSQFTPTTTVASAAGATWNGVDIPATTATLTGTTAVTTATGFNLLSIQAPTITDASAVTITHAATAYIGGAPIQAGSATITNGYALWVDSGKVRFDGVLDLGNSSSTAGSLAIYDANGQKATITVGDLAADRSLTIPVATGSDTFCLQTLANCAGGGGGSTLQGAYDADSNGGDAIITTTTTDGGVVIRDASTTLGTGNLFAVQSNSGTTSYLQVQGNGDVVLGGTSAQAKLTVYDTINAADDGILSEVTLNYASGGIANLRMSTTINPNSIVSSAKFNGSYSDIWVEGSNYNNTSQIFGDRVYLGIGDGTTANVGFVSGYDVSAWIADNMNIDLYYGMAIYDPTHTTSGSIDDNRGLFIENQTLGTANYGLYVEGASTAAIYVGSGLTDLNGNLQINGSTTTYTQRMCHSGSNGATTNMTLGDCQSTGQADLAEMYDTNGMLEPGDVVAPSGGFMVDATSEAYQSNAIGIVSTNPIADGIIGNNVTSINRQPIALAGRVPVKVSLENGPVIAGDYLTPASTPGFAMKATGSGRVIGVALESYDGTGVRVSALVSQEEADRNVAHAGDLSNYVSSPANWPANTGKIMAFVNPTFYAPPIANILQGNSLQINGNTNINGDVQIGSSLNVSGSATFMNGLNVMGSTHLENLVVTGSAEVTTLIVERLISKGDLPTAELGDQTITGHNATISIEGNDTAGTIMYTAGTQNLPYGYDLNVGEQVVVIFNKPYASTPRVVLTPNSEQAANIRYYVQRSGTEFKLYFTEVPTAGSTYSFDYQIIQ